MHGNVNVKIGKALCLLSNSNYLPIGAALYLGRLKSSAVPLWEPQFLQFLSDSSDVVQNLVVLF